MIRRNIELIIWSIAIAYLWMMNPQQSANFSLCFWHNLGIDFCPGCGLGRSIAFFLDGSLKQSFQTHVLGIPALMLLLARIFQLLLNQKKICVYYNIYRK